MKRTGYNSIKSWGITVACGFVFSMLKLPITSSSMLFVAFVDRYDTVRQNAAFFMTVVVLVRCITGPLTGILGGIMDLRHITIYGCLIASLGTACCYFAQDIMAVTVLLGLIYGVGVSIAQPLLPQILKQHFNKSLANANGVSNSVSCILSIVLIPVISILLKLYDVPDALLIASGIMLHGIPVAMLLKNPEYNNIHSSLSTEPSTEETSSCKIEKYQSTTTEIKGKIRDSILESGHNETHSSFCKHIAESTQLNKAPACVHPQNYDYVYNVTNETIERKQPLNKIQQEMIKTPIKSPTNVDLDVISEENHKNIFKQNPTYDQSLTSHKQNKYKDAFKTLIVFRDLPFLIITLCQSLHTYVAVFFYLILIEISRDKGFPQSQEYVFLIVFNVAELLGHTCLGWVTDKGYLTVSNYMSIGFMGLGSSCVSYVLSNNYVLIMIATMCFGLSFAAIFSASPSLVYEFIEEKHQTMAIASRLIFYTPLIFTMAPLIEYFRGTLGSYDGALYLLTGICIGCAVLLLLLPFIVKCSNRKK